MVVLLVLTLVVLLVLTLVLLVLTLVDPHKCLTAQRLVILMAHPVTVCRRLVLLPLFLLMAPTLPHMELLHPWVPLTVHPV